MCITPMKLKLQATRAVLRQKDLKNLEEKQLPMDLPKTLRKELAKLVKMRAGKYRVCEVFTKAERSDGKELTAHMWKRVKWFFRMVHVGDMVETRWTWTCTEDMDEEWQMYMDVEEVGDLAWMT